MNPLAAEKLPKWRWGQDVTALVRRPEQTGKFRSGIAFHESFCVAAKRPDGQHLRAKYWRPFDLRRRVRDCCLRRRDVFVPTMHAQHWDQTSLVSYARFHSEYLRPRLARD